MNEDIKIYIVELYDLCLNDNGSLENYVKSFSRDIVESTKRITIGELIKDSYDTYRSITLTDNIGNQQNQLRGKISRSHWAKPFNLPIPGLYVIKKGDRILELATGHPVNILKLHLRDMNENLWYGSYSFLDSRYFGIITGECDLSNQMCLDNINRYLEWASDIVSMDVFATACKETFCKSKSYMSGPIDNIYKSIEKKKQIEEASKKEFIETKEKVLKHALYIKE